MCEWTKNNTDKNSVFISTDDRFKFYAQRATKYGIIDASTADTNYCAFWYYYWDKINQATKDRAISKLVGIAKDLKADFIVVSKDFPKTSEVKQVYSNQYYKIYKIL